ncbi:cytochrome b/b6 domain-containing protein [Paracoccaceae bacterium]|nr:cytochrome b/b6 domain-containing protein [Paracoccaceae bacterium]
MRYPLGIIVLHWTTAALMLALALSGLLYSYKIVGSNALIFHQWGGQLFLVLVFIWIGVRVAFGVGPRNPDHMRWEKVLSALVKITLYVLLVAYVVTGYVTASGLRSTELFFPINVAFARSDLGDLFMEAHFALKWVLFAVLALHLLGTLKHSFIDRDNTFRNIWITKKG